MASVLVGAFVGRGGEKVSNLRQRFPMLTIKVFSSVKLNPTPSKIIKHAAGWSSDSRTSAWPYMAPGHGCHCQRFNAVALSQAA